jgi:hypothetical protein
MRRPDTVTVYALFPSTRAGYIPLFDQTGDLLFFS